LTPQAINRLLPNQNGTQANPATKRPNKIHSVEMLMTHVRAGVAASLGAKPICSVASN
jgi:hypothetical protein